MTHELRSEQLTVIIKDDGAEVASVKSRDGFEFMWQAKKDVWPRHAPVLFPIVGKLKDNSFNHKGKACRMSQHGFARDRKFDLAENSETGCTFELRSDAETRKMYPFDFSFRIRYILKDDALITEYVTENTGRDKMFFSVGAHPGFALPLETGARHEDHYISFDHDTFIQTCLHDGLRSASNKVLPLVGKKLYLSSSLFNDDALVFENRQVNEISLCCEGSGRRVTIQCHNWPYFGIWSKKGSDGFVCLEPWYGIADHVNSSGELEDKEGIISLEPGKVHTCAFTTIFS